MSNQTLIGRHKFNKLLCFGADLVPFPTSNYSNVSISMLVQNIKKAFKIPEYFCQVVTGSRKVAEVR